MLSIINRLLLMLVFTGTIISCSYSQDGNKSKGGSNDLTSEDNYEAELTPEQQAAFDALNTLQTSTDEMNHLYSTFANHNQPFYPADTSFEVSQSELLVFMEQFISKHCQNLSPEIQNQLAKSAVQAQDKYTVLYCTRSILNTNYENGLPMTGVWVMPNILGRRDVILVW